MASASVLRGDKRRQGGGQRVFVGNAIVDSNGTVGRIPTHQQVVEALLRGVKEKTGKNPFRQSILTSPL